MYSRKLNSYNGVSTSQTLPLNMEKYKSNQSRNVSYPYREFLSKSSKGIPRNYGKSRYMSPTIQEKNLSYDITHNSPPELPQEDENSINENIDEFSKPNPGQIPHINMKSDKNVCCPFCHKNINSVIENLINELKNGGNTKEPLAIKTNDSQLSEKIKTHYFPPKKSLMSESIQCSRTSVSGSGTFFELQSTSVPNSNLPTNRTLKDISLPNDFSNLLYELAEHKAKLAEALHSNDESLYELQKKQVRIKELEDGTKEKEVNIDKIAKENFLLRKECFGYKETINQLNLNQKNLLKSLNKFMKLQISLKT